MAIFVAACFLPQSGKKDHIVEILAKKRGACVESTYPQTPELTLWSRLESSRVGEWACFGAVFTWNVGWILDSYPLAILRSNSRFNPGYNLLSVDIVLALPLATANVIRAGAQESGGKNPIGRLSRNRLEKKLDNVNKQLERIFNSVET
ncbi:hypothetical protein K438DRAFT_1776901 [Mycena galopus ATCC 62051]|nr:hypothetical protein K438DRAFT_1776901 [Mycena galopus ATCC 62051]